MQAVSSLQNGCTAPPLNWQGGSYLTFCHRDICEKLCQAWDFRSVERVSAAPASKGKTVMKQFGGVGNPVNSQWRILAHFGVLGWESLTRTRLSHKAGPALTCICHFLAPEVLVLVLATVKPNLEAGESFGDIAHSQTLLRNHTKQIANLRNCVAIPENLADGMVLVVDYWQSQNLNWLDGVGCGYGKEYCAVSYTGEMTR